MEISKALELLREYLGELEHLRTLHYGNEERWLWKNKVDVVLEAAFGKLSYEYYKLNPPIVISEDGFIEEARPTKYLENLKQYETGIKQILDKYKILGVRTKSATLAEPAKASEEGKTRYQKIWQWIKSHKIPSIIITAIMLIAAIITIVGFAMGFFS